MYYENYTYGDGQISKQKFVVKEGESISFTGLDKNFIELVVTEHEIGDGENIKLDFVISRENEDGKMVVLSKPKIITGQNKKSHIETTTEGGEKVSLIVKAKRL